MFNIHMSILVTSSAQYCPMLILSTLSRQDSKYIFLQLSDPAPSGRLPLPTDKQVLMNEYLDTHKSRMLPVI